MCTQEKIDEQIHKCLKRAGVCIQHLLHSYCVTIHSNNIPLTLLLLIKVYKCFIVKSKDTYIYGIKYLYINFVHCNISKKPKELGPLTTNKQPIL